MSGRGTEESSGAELHGLSSDTTTAVHVCRIERVPGTFVIGDLLSFIQSAKQE